MRGSEAGTRI